MAKALLKNVEMGKCWTTYIGAIDGILRGAGLWNDDIYMLMGMTGMAFHFIVHETLCPSSVTVYNWGEEHFAMMDRIGVHTDTYYYFNDRRMNTFQQIQDGAIQRIKASIDRGVAVMIWAPTPLLEFGLICGYDDEDGVFFVKDCIDPEPDPLLYQNIGRSEVPILSFQIVNGRIPVDPEKIYRESLAFGVYEWNKLHHTAPRYASGRKGYEYLLHALEGDSFNVFGLTYMTHVYANSKDYAARYLRFVAEESRHLKGLKDVAQIYREVADGFAQVAKVIPFCLPDQASITPAQAQEALRVFTDCLAWEEKAMGIMGKVLGNSLEK